MPMQWYSKQREALSHGPEGPSRQKNQRNCLLDRFDDYGVSADLPEWVSHPSIIRETRLKPDTVINSSSTKQLIMVELTIPYENRLENAHICREKYLNLIKELRDARIIILKSSG